MRKWSRMPAFLRCDEVRYYYSILMKRERELKIKFALDKILAFCLLCIFFIPMCVIAVMIVTDSKGGVFYRQKRVTAYGKIFRIHKFRTMVKNADTQGTLVTVADDCRITKVGAFLRKYKLDELPQLIDVLQGNMSFVGTRPEVPEYVKKYSREMRATLLLPAGITSEASIEYKDEASLLDAADDPDRMYTKKILPEKMKYNLASLENFSLINDLKTILRTALAIL